MILNYVVQGDYQTTLHDFVITQEGMQVIISPGSYVRGGVELVRTEAPLIVDINIPPVDLHFELWITTTEITILNWSDERPANSVIDPIDRLCWFTVPAYIETLDDVEINCVRMILGVT